MLMIVAVFVVLGLCLGSFVNALVWRVHEQAKKSARSESRELSILHGRSICPSCKHTLGALDLLPLFSWLFLRGKCRYCKKPISVQYPLVEVATSLLFVASYIWWPVGLHSWQIAIFGLWLLLLTGLVALFVYDLRWYLLPNRILYPLGGLAGLMAVIAILSASRPFEALVNEVLAVAIGGGIFYLLFQLSGGKWIGGGDVKLGWLLGLVLGMPGKALLFIFLAAVLGTLASLPLLATNRLQRTSTIPFGPFLIVGAILAELFGASIIHWYTHGLIGV